MRCALHVRFADKAASDVLMQVCNRAYKFGPPLTINKPVMACVQPLMGFAVGKLSAKVSWHFR